MSAKVLELLSVESRQGQTVLTRRIHDAINGECFELDDRQSECLTISVSIGATLSRDAADDLKTMLARADRAMYTAKQAGRDQTHIE